MVLLDFPVLAVDGCFPQPCEVLQVGDVELVRVSMPSLLLALLPLLWWRTMLGGYLTDIDTSTQSRVHRRGFVFLLVVPAESRLFIYACLLILRNEHFCIEASLIGQLVFEILLFSLILGFGLVGHLTQTSSFHVIRRR